MTENMWPEKPKIFTTWPFTEKSLQTPGPVSPLPPRECGASFLRQLSGPEMTPAPSPLKHELGTVNTPPSRLPVPQEHRKAHPPACSRAVCLLLPLPKVHLQLITPAEASLQLLMLLRLLMAGPRLPILEAKDTNVWVSGGNI